MAETPVAPVGGRIGNAIALMAQAWHIAIGRGDPAWDAVDRAAPLWENLLLPDPVTHLVLVDEIGRRPLDEIAFVLPDAAGEIVLPDSRWKRSAVPTNHLYFAATFDFADGAGHTVRELGLFMGTQVDADVPPGQMWLPPTDLVSTGYLYQLQRYEFPFTRSPSVRPLFHFVVTV